MLKRDFIMVQIEELGKVIAQMIFNRNSNDGARKNPGMIQTVYSSLKLDRDTLLTASPEELRRMLDGDDFCGLQRLEIAVKTFIEESYLTPAQRIDMLLKAKEILQYIQTHDNTFSLERVSLINEIENGLMLK